MDIVISHLNFNSKHHDKCKFELQLISLATTSNLFLLEIVHKCQHCQLCVLWENLVSNETNADVRMYIEEFTLVEIWIHCCTKLK